MSEVGNKSEARQRRGIVRGACRGGPPHADRHPDTEDGRTRRSVHLARASRQSAVGTFRVRRIDWSVDSTRALAPPCRVPPSAARPAMTDGVGIPAGRRDTTRREGGHVDLAIGAQDQRAAQQVETVRAHAPRAGEPGALFGWALTAERAAALVSVWRMRHPVAALSGGPKVERRRIARRAAGQRRLCAREKWKYSAAEH